MERLESFLCGLRVGRILQCGGGVIDDHPEATQAVLSQRRLVTTRHRLGFPKPLIRQLQLNRQPLIYGRELQAQALFELLDRVERVVRERGRRREGADAGSKNADRRHREGHPQPTVSRNAWYP